MIRCSLQNTSLLYFAYFVFSPMDVNYRWSFLVGDQPCIERRQRIIPAQTYVVADDEDETKPAIATDEPPQQTQPVCYYEHVDNNILSPTHTCMFGLISFCWHLLPVLVRRFTLFILVLNMLFCYFYLRLFVQQVVEVEVDENAKDIEQEKENVTGAQQVAIEVTGASRAATTPALLDAGEGGLAHVTEPEPKVGKSRSSLFLKLSVVLSLVCALFSVLYSAEVTYYFPTCLFRAMPKWSIRAIYHTVVDLSNSLLYLHIPLCIYIH